tara:strand:- start:39 stop:674 length:636 start_codon:yes stop_codon:yes gene_type:complete
MAQDLDDIKLNALDVFGYNANDPILDATTLTRLVNSALQQLSTEFDWPWLYDEGTITTVAGTTDYAVPTNWSRTKWLAIDEDELQFRSLRDMRRIMGDTDIQRQPVFYATVGDTSIRLGQIPDAVYTVDHGYFKQEAALSAGGDAPLLDSAYDDMLVMYVAKKMAMRKGETRDINQAQREIDAWLKRTRDNVRRTSAFPRIITRNDWSSRI